MQNYEIILTIPNDNEIGFLDSNQIEKCYKCGYKTAIKKIDEIDRYCKRIKKTCNISYKE